MHCATHSDEARVIYESATIRVAITPPLTPCARDASCWIRRYRTDDMGRVELYRATHADVEFFAQGGNAKIWWYI